MQITNERPRAKSLSSVLPRRRLDAANNPQVTNAPAALTPNPGIETPTPIRVAGLTNPQPCTRNATAVQMFEKMAAAQPDKTALETRTNAMTYGELNATANQLARVLQSHGIGRESVVGIAMHKSLDMVVAMLAIWKAGGAYVPLDPQLPYERLDYMAKDSGCALILSQTQVQNAGKIHPAKQMPVYAVNEPAMHEKIAAQPEENLPPVSGVDNPAYIIYTSGTTGQPKGVQIEHINLPNMANR